MPEWLIRQWLRYAAFQLEHGPEGWLVSCPPAVFAEWEQAGWAREVPVADEDAFVRLSAGGSVVARRIALTPLGQQIARERAGAPS